MTVSGRYPPTGFRERVYLIPATPAYLPILRQWHAADPVLERRLSGFYAQGDGWVKELVEHETRFGWIVYRGTDRGTEPVGFADLDVDPDEMIGHLALYVAPPFRRQGTGLQTIGLVIREAHRQDVRGLAAEVEEENQPASQLLEKAGFTFVATREPVHRNRLYTLSLLCSPS